MRIWLQSGTPLRSEAKWAPYLEAELDHLERCKDPRSEIRLEGVEKPLPSVEASSHSRYLNIAQLLQCGITAQTEGYDVFVMIGLGPAGHDELREQLKIPVVFSEAVAWRIAPWLYGRFAILGHDRNVYFRRVEQVRVAGASDQLVPGGFIDCSVDDILQAFNDSRTIVADLEDCAKRARDSGANVLIPDFNPLNALLIRAGVRELAGVPLLDTAGFALKAGEFIVSAQRAGVWQRSD